ncbi:DUF2125 domain-containing protein [Sulfitobacter sp. S190]|uniref:DUF2125 domain-containing protein n=1 Tax=Sulfitobacter sp. S190 TaxID=2867022 RepID=UPI0021A59908|nr:DUF2125 domain-containing protein [Sulfitobacter sp. S190]UWR23114.1 DUF2125 domain-containing protein [Sulfitobacter sp. S190]
MKRRLLGILVAVFAIWGLWWWIATGAMLGGVQTWLNQQRTMGLTADVETTERAGFPLRIGADLTDLALGDPATGSTARVPDLRMSSPIYWPGFLTVTLPQDTIYLSGPRAEATLTAMDARADLRLRPGARLQMQSARITAAPITLNLVEGRLLDISEVDIVAQQAQDDARTYALRANATDLAPGSVLRQALRLPEAWPAQFETLRVDMDVTFDQPWDRGALAGPRPQPRAILLRQAEAQWGALRIALTADLVVDAQGVPTGTANITAQNWERMLDLAEAGGAITADVRSGIAQALSLLSRMNGSDDTLDLEITLEDGRMQMGFIPLGNAPRFIIR